MQYKRASKSFVLSEGFKIIERIIDSFDILVKDTLKTLLIAE